VATARVKEEAASVAPTKTRVVLQLLKSLEVVKERRGAKVSLLKPHLSGGALDGLAERYRQRHADDHDKLSRMMEYGQSARCRWQVLLDYFGAGRGEACGACDNCRNPLESHIAPPGSTAA
jgi:ATP-dependent DNA helicase RecQ